jgi:3-octaprenyl-4-hydroxybenzoate carboxy-lyase Rift-related domain
VPITSNNPQFSLTAFQGLNPKFLAASPTAFSGRLHGKLTRGLQSGLKDISGRPNQYLGLGRRWGFQASPLLMRLQGPRDGRSIRRRSAASRSTRAGLSSTLLCILVPAHAEIVIEGEVTTTAYEPEAPFGEAAGFIAPRIMRPFFDVKCITHRRDPIFMNILSQFPPARVVS